MKKKYKVSLISLLAAFIAAIVIAVCALGMGSRPAFASDRYVTVDGSNVFYTSIRGAEVTAGKETTTNDSGASVDRYWTLFKIGKDETVSYRKSLAYKWLTGAKDAEGKLTGEYVLNRFSMKIGFDSLAFERYIIAFQSQQYIKAEDNITKNYLVFTPAENNRVNIAAVQSLEDEIETYPVSCSVASNAKIGIAFDKFESGTVTLEITGTEVQGEGLEFKNVYEPYASYISSGDNAVTPLTFSAEFAEGADESVTADMKLYDINGQSFELYAHDTDGVYNDVIDTAPPVMCFSKTPSYVEFGKKLDFSYQVIDVLASSPRSTASFYVLTGAQYEAEDYDYSKTDYEDGSDDKDEEDELKKNPYITVSSGTDIRVIKDSNTFIPAKYLEGGEEYSKDYSVHGLIKIYYEVSDVTGSTAQKDTVFVNWYANDDALVDIYELKNVEGRHDYFLKVIDGKRGVSYASEATTVEAYKEEIAELQKKYQEKIDETVKELKDGKLYAGSKSEFYLPAFDLIEGDEYCGIQDYRYSVYYKAKTTSSNTSLAYNKLAIGLTEADVTYRFTVFVTDEFGNPMVYPDGVDANGKIIWKEITTTDIWDEDFADLLPFFEFDVSYKMAEAEDPASHSIAYVGTNYTGANFDIKGVSGTYTDTYSLYVFDRNAAYKDCGINLTYSQFVENFDKLFNNTYRENVNTRQYFTTVKPASELKESDENYELFKEINWNASTRNFTPQSAEDFYIVRLTLTDNRSQISTNNIVVIAASIQANSIKGESDWLENNMVSVILLSIAAVLFIALIVLIVVKPKDKGDIDVIYESSNKKNKSNKKK